MVYRVTEKDFDEIINMVENLVLAIGGVIPVNRAKTYTSLLGIYQSQDGFLMRSKNGFIAGILTRTIISDVLVASEQGWYAEDGSGQELLNCFEEWAIGRGARIIQLSCKGEAIQTKLQALGYQVAETAMVKQIGSL